MFKWDDKYSIGLNEIDDQQKGELDYEMKRDITSCHGSNSQPQVIDCTI